MAQLGCETTAVYVAHVRCTYTHGSRGDKERAAPWLDSTVFEMPATGAKPNLLFGSLRWRSSTIVEPSGCTGLTIRQKKEKNSRLSRIHARTQMCVCFESSLIVIIMTRRTRRILPAVTVSQHGRCPMLAVRRYTNLFYLPFCFPSTEPGILIPSVRRPQPGVSIHSRSLTAIPTTVLAWTPPAHLVLVPPQPNTAN